MCPSLVSLLAIARKKLPIPIELYLPSTILLLFTIYPGPKISALILGIRIEPRFAVPLSVEKSTLTIMIYNSSVIHNAKPISRLDLREIHPFSRNGDTFKVGVSLSTILIVLLKLVPPPRISAPTTLLILNVKLSSPSLIVSSMIPIETEVSNSPALIVTGLVLVIESKILIQHCRSIALYLRQIQHLHLVTADLISHPLLLHYH